MNGRKHLQQPWRSCRDCPGPAIFDLKGKKLYDLKGINIYKPSGDLVGHLANSEGADKHLDKATDKLFSAD